MLFKLSWVLASEWDVGLMDALSPFCLVQLVGFQICSSTHTVSTRMSDSTNTKSVYVTELRLGCIEKDSEIRQAPGCHGRRSKFWLSQRHARALCSLSDYMLWAVCVDHASSCYLSISLVWGHDGRSVTANY